MFGVDKTCLIAKCLCTACSSLKAAQHLEWCKVRSKYLQQKKKSKVNCTHLEIRQQKYRLRKQHLRIYGIFCVSPSWASGPAACGVTVRVGEVLVCFTVCHTRDKANACALIDSSVWPFPLSLSLSATHCSTLFCFLHSPELCCNYGV